MTDIPFEELIGTPEDIETVLCEILAAAEQNDLDPRGTTVCSTDDPSQTDYEVMVYELEKTS
ncbi:MAG: hypothetical protein J07HN4v3_01387 [Halonotius sp. J07HN4]|nr:MAG: hypothetical protein J07HN4v3_01387 [Halonotius sp. J07HN4]